MNKTENLDILLIQMPVATHFTPALGLSLLKSAVRRKGYSAKIKYYSLKFTKLIGIKNNFLLLGGFNELLGEWLFSGTLFDNLPPDEEYIQNIINPRKNNESGRADPHLTLTDMDLLLLGIKSKTEKFINSCLEDLLPLKPKIVGFTTSFEQNLASLSLAKRIKQHLPETVIVFGGANCEGSMGREIIRKFPFVDIVVSGEADHTFPELVESIFNQADYTGIKGVICQQNLANHANGIINAPMITDMDSLPVPDYDDYFEEMANYHIDPNVTFAYLPFESSRGCWWGEVSHCTFCGFNGTTMAHRSKSAARVMHELKFLMNRYKTKNFEAADNILDLGFFKDFIPALISEDLKLNLFYETKSNLTREQIKLLKDANLKSIQAGVESLNTHVLDIMKKGVKSIQNVQLLKWCTQYGLFVKWGVLWGFPNETKEDYYETAALIPKISHLNRPGGIGRHSIHRFSPNFNAPEKFGFTKIYPAAGYKYIYPFEEESIYNFAFKFDYDYVPDDNLELAINATSKAIENWKAGARESALFFIDKQEALIIFDLRPVATRPYFILRSKERFLYLFCDKIQPFSKIKKEYSQYFNQEINEAEINSILDSLIERNLMLKENNSYLSLALPLGIYSPNKEVFTRLINVMRNIQSGDIQVSVNNNNELLINLKSLPEGANYIRIIGGVRTGMSEK